MLIAQQLTGHRMQSHRYQRRANQIAEHSPAEAVNNDCIENDLDERVDDLEAIRRLWIHHQRTKDVEERLQTHPAELAERRAEQFRFHQRRKICVDDFVALVTMMLEMVFLERNRHRNTKRKIAEEAEQAVRHRSRKSEK